MSEIKIQSSPEPEQGAQKPLASDSRRGNENLNQNTMSFSRGQQVDIDQGTNPRVAQGEINGVSGKAHSGTSDGLSVAGRAVAVRHVDQRCIQGSYPGDSRAKASPAQLPPNPGPREGTGTGG